ncbi:hypothetical protein [Seonamhaeicola marinus]|uniref:DUF3872 domain-containing protein n=1 Tax=Seonamhaeicola marinus TaxID=1912246 RepID=A0A5D0I727_9FLAO|nr:hypothetical protein [Seonamhaeicola marinus]TYA78749.1 hypothetical protein FUA24_10380 [Seonamhaeicola marinus]
MKHYLSIFLVFSFFAFTACDDVVDCIINVRPELKNKELDHAHVDEYYFETVSAEIKNETRDNDYDYFFRVSGDLPRGLDVIYERRKVVFEGIPREPGRYTIRVHLEVEAFNEYYFDEYGNERYHDPLCSNNTSKVYTLVVR